eukprot:CAMPEP_0172402210 /NCGR_PEP_ID=MMETSP1061-20121228/53797_1 /TAXON_ID=37318 /ORGANISM="Pseudo-nitzschia pungens, Strain cf. pungens" /LENGTH=401 /DNA_ID=CAMNT_0013136127 /DNA_START=214 /DNA_END=1416 /DNA_ORIENTATION=+
MEGQPWASSSRFPPSNSTDIRLMHHHRSSEPSCPRNYIYRNTNANAKDEWCLVCPHQLDIATKAIKASANKIYSLQVKGHTTPNCGGAGIGLLLEDLSSNQIVWSARLYVPGDRTILEADYSAMIMGMDYVHNVLKVRQLTVLSSNGIVVNQVRGVFTVTKSSLTILLESVRNIRRHLHNFSIQEITPAENSDAHAQAVKAFATRKSLNIDDRNWKVERNDPIRSIRRNPHKMGRWRKPDDPAQSAIIDPSRTYRLQFDGGVKQGVGVGMVLYDDQGKEIWCGWHFHPEVASNNVAEYTGLVCGLRCARSLGVAKLIVEGDSLLVVRQMNERYRKREGELVMFRREAREIINDLSYFCIRKISRAENKRADWLANHAMTLRESDGFIRKINYTSEGWAARC